MALGVGAISALGCEAPAAQPAVHVAVVDEAAEPLANVEVRLDGQPVGTTSGEGEIWVRWSVQRTGRLGLSVRCPDGYRSPEPRTVRARHDGLRRLRLRCAAETHSAFLAIAAPGGEGLPVRVDGEWVADIPAQGVLHAEVERPAGSEVRVTIDTGERPKLRPQHPVVEARLDRDEVIVLQPKFERAVTRRVRRVRSHRPSRPQRLRRL